MNFFTMLFSKTLGIGLSTESKFPIWIHFFTIHSHKSLLFSLIKSFVSSLYCIIIWVFSISFLLLSLYSYLLSNFSMHRLALFIRDRFDYFLEELVSLFLLLMTISEDLLLNSLLIWCCKGRYFNTELLEFFSLNFLCRVICFRLNGF